MGRAEHQPNASDNNVSMNNDNNEVSQRETTMLSMSMLEVKATNERAKNKRAAVRVDALADMLVDKFRAPASRGFFCKCAWNLSDDEIWSTFERANKVGIRKPINYFVRSCSEMIKKKQTQQMQH